VFPHRDLSLSIRVITSISRLILWTILFMHLFSIVCGFLDKWHSKIYT
jgi:hypothetical protein